MAGRHLLWLARTLFMRLFVEKLTSIDSSYLCPRHGIVGESWLLDVELGGDLNAQQMLFDFADVKRTIKRYVDATFDHKLLLPVDYPGIKHLPAVSDSLCLSFATDRGQAYLAAPAQAISWLPGATVDATTLAQAIADGLRPLLPDNVAQIQIHLRHEDPAPPHFHYSHGLRMHDGNCQRIAHGHRSRLRISRDGHYDEALSRAWCQRWQYVYLGHDLDRCRWQETPFAAHAADSGLLCFAYNAGQGAFAIALPEHWCELVNVDTTIEQIAGHIARSVAPAFPQQQIEVRVYEGVEKGAIAILAAAGTGCPG